jgi:hypothetical protein
MNALFIPPMTSAKNRQPTRKQHDHLTKKLDLPCFVCGVKFSTLKDKTQSRYGAKAMETHHHVIEDNLWVLCDVHHRAKFLGIHEITYPIWCPMDFCC